ncbi:hypothetical protein SISNIDRAFT_471723 [Sistotremastrum niveocremeum HHB9708]|uniref:Uncharacterized protein n=1 Tax=Sistotremastrum niveocremeum HHB9708 TaxID=1314777 RepID=A0A164MAH9_9AGAM|nr:hypothetical protein SISNIDRAFT_471723 [Sistotremastrum niveocremeum HHB9708]
MTKHPLSPIQLHLSPVAALTRITDLLVLNYLPWTAVFTRIRVPPATSKSMGHVRRDDTENDRDEGTIQCPNSRWMGEGMKMRMRTGWRMGWLMESIEMHGSSISINAILIRIRLPPPPLRIVARDQREDIYNEENHGHDA